MRFMQHQKSLTVTLVTIFLSLIVACASSNTSPQTNATPKPLPKTISTAELARLRWIEGSWKGTGDIDKPFFERYKLENETTLLVEGFPDEKFEKASDSDRFELKNGEFGKFADGAGYVATAMDDRSIDFAPLGKSKNGFRWQMESADSWKAILTWRETPGGPVKERVYIMTRVKP